MALQRISLLVALDAIDDGLKRALDAATQQFQQLAANAQSAGQQASAGLQPIQAGLASIGQQIEQAKTQLLAFLTIDWAWGQLQQIVTIADAWNQMNARLRLATAGQQEFITAQVELFGIAQRIGVPVQEVATLYGKLQQAIRMLGGDQKEALSLTESISQALRISGTSAAEAEAVLLQFGQALAAGVLRGEEFNSVVENSPRLAQALADGLNVPIGRLRKMAEEGRLTADIVVKALQSQKDRLAAEYAQLPATVSVALERISNAFGQWVHRIDVATGFTQKLAGALTWVAQNFDLVMAAVQRLAELGLAVLAYRLIPALITAWQSVTAAAVTAATATTAAWTTANLSITAATANLGKLKLAFALLGAFAVGWEIGTWLSEKFAIVRQAGVFMIQVLMTGIEQLQYRWEVFAAIFTNDTLAAAHERHRSRLAEMNEIFREMYVAAGQSQDAVAGAITTAGDAAEALARQLDAVRQGTQEAAGRGVEAVHEAVEKLSDQIGQVEQAAGRANQVINDAMAKMAQAYQGMTQLIEAALQQQIQAIQLRYQQEQAALAQSSQSQAQQIAQSTQLLLDALTQQTTLRQTATANTLQLIEQESMARREAARRQGETEEERRANVQRIDNELLATKRQTLLQALSDYRQHIDALNTEANRHLNEVKRIEEAKRQLSLSTEERVRELRRQGMAELEATEDRKRQIAEYQAKAREALAQGEFDQARQLGQKAMDLAAQVASSQTSTAQQATAARQQAEQSLSQITQLETQARAAHYRQEYSQAESLMRQADQLRTELAQKTQAADAASVKSKEAVNQAIQQIRQSEDLLQQTLEAEAQAHQRAAQSALSARDQIQQTLSHTQSQIDQITATLQKGLKLTLEADTNRVQQALTELDRSLAERARLVVIQADLTQAEQQLRQLEQQLKEGKTVLVDADVTKAKEALTKLNTYATDTAQIELKVATEKAQAAITNVEGQIQALDRLQTSSTHRISTNTEAARAEIKSLQGLNTSSTHTIQVKKVETKASGGIVGLPIPAYAKGGRVMPGFPRMASGTVPGSGNSDTVPRTLETGAFVVRKAAVQKYGSGRLAQLAHQVAAFATGGAVGGFETRRSTSAALTSGLGKNSSKSSKKNREVAEVWKTIELGLQGMVEYIHWFMWNQGVVRSTQTVGQMIDPYGKQAQQDERTVEALLDRPQLTTNERSTLNRIKQVWREAMMQPLNWGKDLERELIEYMTGHEAEFFRRGGLAKSDTVPAMLTPGEYVVSKQAVARHGVGLFEAINNLTLPKEAVAQRIQGFAAGGWVRPLASATGQVSQRIQRAPLLDPTAQLLASMAQVAKAPKLPDLPAQPAPTKTIRVELAAGSQRVSATLAAQDEIRLLDLLKNAQSRVL